jgi:hypothetical protein
MLAEDDHVIFKKIISTHEDEKFLHGKNISRL